MFSVVNAWDGGFVAGVKVTASSPVTGWNVNLTRPAGTVITNLWNGVRTGDSVANASWNGSFPAGASTDFGFQGNGSATGIAVTGCTAS